MAAAAVAAAVRRPAAKWRTGNVAILDSHRRKYNLLHILRLMPHGQSNHLNLFNNRPQPKKKRKSRTAFTNHQIFELEKRFLYQKYLSPADRDEIASSLGLSNAQVITWFQNRRAKLKRDMEELKKDVESAKVLSAHKTFLENVTDLGILKKKAMSIGASEEAATNLVVNASK
ncbi:unnamed protein product [Plutella xylostella]|uniref:(diamondback moth) hypothetical protein n=1 Tax=Plutella xylostella TaxID=51655 RepID=A0A8S4ERM4_PLUXY|nr:unnamed protein product [Plutella xylostella]